MNNKIKILVVEDHPLNRDLLKEMLELIKCTVDTTESGPDAIQLCQKYSYDIILMDIQMPGMDGITATQLIRKIPQHTCTPVIAITAHALAGDREKFLKAGLDDYLSKPISLERLKALIHKHIAEREINK